MLQRIACGLTVGQERRNGLRNVLLCKLVASRNDKKPLGRQHEWPHTHWQRTLELGCTLRFRAHPMSIAVLTERLHSLYSRRVPKSLADCLQVARHARPEPRCKQVNVAIFHPSTPNLEPVHSLVQAGIQVVVLERLVPGYPCIVADDEGGGYLATGHLLDLGHRRIGCIVRAGDPTTSSARVD